jgi:hypothetical protein
MTTMIRISVEPGKSIFVNAASILYVEPWLPEKGMPDLFWTSS